MKQNGRTNPETMKKRNPPTVNMEDSLTDLDLPCEGNVILVEGRGGGRRGGSCVLAAPPPVRGPILRLCLLVLPPTIRRPETKRLRRKPPSFGI